MVQPRLHGEPGRGGNRKSQTIGATHVVLDVRASRMDVSIAHGRGKYIDAGKCAGRVFCGRYCCGQRRARFVRVDQGIPDGKELPKAIEVEKPLLSTVPAFVVRPEFQKGTSWDSQGREAWHWHVLVWTDGSRDSGVSEWLKAHTAQEDPCTAFWVEQSQYSDEPLKEVDERETHWPWEGTLYLHYHSTR